MNKCKKIIIVLNDTIDRFQEYQATGVMNQVIRRAVEIELTPLQIKQISQGKSESIESVSSFIE
jgi:hypothetical protein